MHHWMELEVARGVVPTLAASILLHFLGAPLPVTATLLIGAMGWMVFVLWQAGAVAFRLNKKHEAHMRAVGIGTDLRVLLTDKHLWRKSAAGLTMRELIAERRKAPPRK